MSRLPRTRLALAVALCLSLDVANPMMPGALGFGVQNSVDSRQADRARVDDVAGALPPAPTGEQVEGLDPGPARSRLAPGVRHARITHAFRRASAPPSSHAAPAPSDDD